MKRVFWGIFLSIFFGFMTYAWAVQVNPVGVYWDLQASYGSGSGVGNGTIDSESSQYLTPSLPHQYTIPKDKELVLEDSDGYFYVYSSYNATNTDNFYALIFGMADEDYSTNTDWYYALSKVAVASNPFGGESLFTLSFDWNIDFDFDTVYDSGRAGYAVGLIDWTETTDPNNPVFVHQEKVFFTDDASGHYENSWSLDPTHEYLFGVGILAEISGTSYADSFVEITNLNAQAVPEPASMLLVGAGLGALALFGQKKKA